MRFVVLLMILSALMIVPLGTRAAAQDVVSVPAWSEGPKSTAAEGESIHRLLPGSAIFGQEHRYVGGAKLRWICCLVH
jgi:hypothetical protein